VSGFLLDTNVVSELVKPRPEPRVISWIQATEESLLFLSVLTIGEIRKGISSLPSGNKRALLESWLGNDLLMRFTNRILSIDFEIAARWGLLSAQSKGMPVVDGLLAATALHHNLTFVTRNTSDVKLAGLGVFNPWIS
jgi:toxin FitB